MTVTLAPQQPVPSIPQIIVARRVVNQTAAQVLASTVIPSDGTYLVSGCLRTISGTTYSVSLLISATDELGGNISKNIPLMIGGIVQLAGNADGFQSYNGLPLHIRAKQGTTLQVATNGTFTSIVYNAEAQITKISD